MNRVSASLMAVSLAIGSSCSFAEEEREIQDMSDPLAVYTLVGGGWTNKGLYINLGKFYDPDIPNTMAMHQLEFQGLLGEQIGWDSNDVKDDSLDTIRYRNFKVNTENGRGAQIDLFLNLKESAFAEETVTASYGIIQALPKLWRFNFYPLAGAGVAAGHDVLEEDGDIDSGVSLGGVFGLVGMYSKFTITDKMWINFNPFYNIAAIGSSEYEDNAYGIDNRDILLWEAVLSYQFTPRFNLRAFSNWSDEVDYMDGDHRIEFNYQL